MARTFLLKHESSGKFMHPFGGWSIPGDQTDVIVHSDQHDRMVFEFQPVRGEWGYMVHKSSSKLVHPYLGAVKPSIGTSLVIHSDRHAAALFAIDQVKNRILHKGGLFIHPEGGNANPDNGTKLVLYNTIHDGMRFITVNPNNINEVVDIYGNPHCSGKWEIINMVKTPKATHTYTVSFKVGRSKTESTTSSITMTWEVSIEETRKALTTNASETVQKMIQRSSLATFSEEMTQTHEIKVEKGDTVVTWQYVFTANQFGREVIFRSNMLCDTNSENTKPDPVGSYST